MDLRFPAGQFQKADSYSEDERARFIAEIEETPARLRAAVEGLTAEQLEAPYRPDGWTVRQVAHHLPDSHMNGYSRMKMALTEDEPTIKTYFEDRWAQLADTRTVPVEVSLALLEALHERWVTIWRSLTPAEFTRKFKHPDFGALTLEQHLALYAWHGRHHVAHITSLRERMGW
ncbi:MAG TPA: putative metal-dependent hydrolase [Pyrinomonadaceae bacterium]|nr:putative metal-dependent hydrolase [Pyrinomonadaceae bacterium]